MTRYARLRRGAVTSAVLALIATPFVAIPAQADDEPEAFCDVPGSELAISPVADLAEGEQVDWKSTVKGTAPETFAGEYIGKLSNALGEDAYGNPRDLLLVRLDGDIVNGAGTTGPAGVWAGASGSPVYDADGALIGAVSYGFSTEADNVAGVTPAAAMKSIGDLPSKVAVSRSAKRAIERVTGESSETGTMQQLKPVRVTTGTTAAKLDAVGAKLVKRVPGARKASVNGKAVGGGVDSGKDLPIVSGGNIAVSYSYGAVTSASVGTVTAVCGDQVYAFGHPNSLDSTMIASFHGASTARIMPSAGESYKQVDEIGKRAGVITEDRIAGIRGTIGTFPETTTVSTTMRVGSHSASAKSYVSERWALAQTVYEHVGTEVIRQLENAAVGSAKVSWKISYQRANGKTGSLSNANRYADIAEFPAYVGADVATDVDEIIANEFERVKITGVKVVADVSADYRASRVAGVQMKQAGKWKTVTKKTKPVVKRGKTYAFRSVLKPAGGEATNSTEYTVFKVRVPKSVKKYLDVTVAPDGGDDDEWMLLDDEDVTSSETGASSFPGLVKELDRNSRNDRLVISRDYAHTKTGAATSAESRVLAPQVIAGGEASVRLTVKK